MRGKQTEKQAWLSPGFRSRQTSHCWPPCVSPDVPETGVLHPATAMTIATDPATRPAFCRRQYRQNRLFIRFSRGLTALTGAPTGGTVA
jgi:hypothetical protein